MKYFIPGCILLMIIACDLFGPDEPELIDPINFTWSVDTIDNPGVYMYPFYEIWGSSKHNVYAVGNNHGPNMVHYNGETWDEVDFSPIIGRRLQDMFGLANDDIWLVGSHFIYVTVDSVTSRLGETWLYHYDGALWSVADTLDDAYMVSIGGISSDNFWVGGKDGDLYHYDGSEFKFYPTPLDIDPSWFINVFDIVGDEQGHTYALMDVSDPTSTSRTTYLLKLESGSWTIFDSEPMDTWRSLWLSPTGKLYAAGYNGLDCWDNGYKTTLIDSVHLKDVYGTSDSDFFVTGKKGRYESDDGEWYYDIFALHYNGNTFRDMPIPGVQGYTGGIWTDGTEVFILTVLTDADPQTSAVIHGK